MSCSGNEASIQPGSKKNGEAKAQHPTRVAMDALAGVVASLVTIAHCLSFSALIFGGELASGLPMALWGFMLGTAVVTLLSGGMTTLPPILAGPRNPAVAVMGVLAATLLTAAQAKGMSNSDAAHHVLAALAIATTLTGVLIWVLGAFKLGQAVRFIPYPVIGGFLAASGLLLVLGGIQLGTGVRLDWSGAPGHVAPGSAARLGATLVFASLLLVLRRTAFGAKALPAAIILGAIVIEAVLRAAGSVDGWHLATSGGPQGWSPLAPMSSLDWDLLSSASVEIVSIAGVSTAALLLDVSSIEVQRRAQADMDVEFQINGAANLAIVAVGGLSVGHALNPSRLVDALGGRGRTASIASALCIGLILASGVDLAGMVPRPALGGLLVFLGLGVLGEALKAPGRQSWPELLLTLAIMAAIIGLGYLTGIVLGMVGACLLFAARYSRIGVIRRHVTRMALAAPVERSPEAARLLVEQGERIHVLWLSGYLFFGSSNGLYESIRSAVAPRGPLLRRWVVLDCSGVSGIDASAVLSFRKLVDWASSCEVTLFIAAAPPDFAAELEAAGLVGQGHGAELFVTRNDALELAESELIRASGGDGVRSRDIADWLGRELGGPSAAKLLEGYLQRRELRSGEHLCQQGAPADTIELVAEGSVSVVVERYGADPVRVRRMTGFTVVGEMGFFRRTPRAASVVAEERAVLYVLTRDAYDRLFDANPRLAAEFLQFIVRALSDRMDVANREITALL